MKISVVSFDITNTLIRLKTSLGAICVEAMKAQKLSDVPAASEFDSRIKVARERVFADKIFPTSEERSRKYWRALLWEIFAGHCSNRHFDVAEKFIYERISDAKTWEVFPHVPAALEALKFLNLKLVLLSNGDSRWEKILAKKDLLKFFDASFVSAKTGFAKPDKKAFENVCLSMKISKNELLHVGDSKDFDVVPAQKFGAQSAWFHKFDEFEVVPEKAKIFEDFSVLPEIVRENLITKFSTKSLSRSANILLSELGNFPAESGEKRLYGVLDKSKDTKISSKFISESEARRERNETEPQLAKPLFKKVLLSRGNFEKSLQDEILKNWSEIVPARLVEKCRPDSLKNAGTTLTIFCRGASIRQELEFEKSKILKKISALKGGSRIKKIAFTNS